MEICTVTSAFSFYSFLLSALWLQTVFTGRIRLSFTEWHVSRSSNKVMLTNGILCRPVLLEVPHFASLRGREREVSVLRSDDGRTWKEHAIVTTDEAVQKCLSASFEGEGDCQPGAWVHSFFLSISLSFRPTECVLLWRC